MVRDGREDKEEIGGWIVNDRERIKYEREDEKRKEDEQKEERKSGCEERMSEG